MISYMDEDEDNKWLFYNFATNEYEIVEGEEHGVSKFVAIDENDLWYVSDNGSTLYKYDMKTKTVSIILDHIDSVAVATNTGFAAYIKDTANRKKIHLYDISRKKTNCIASGGWNIYYGDLYDKKCRWSNDGRQFFYMQHFPTLFGARNIKFLIYDIKTHRSFCFYKEKNTLHQFRYIGNCG